MNCEINISNDAEFKQVILSLDGLQKRVLGALFVGDVLSLTADEDVQRAIMRAQDVTVEDDELEGSFKSIKRAMIDSRTRCGADGDWNEQASHFVIRAANAIAQMEEQKEGIDPLWQVAQSCRMARNCALIASGDDSDNPEAQAQYQMLNEFLCER